MLPTNKYTGETRNFHRRVIFTRHITEKNCDWRPSQSWSTPDFSAQIDPLKHSCFNHHRGLLWQPIWHMYLQLETILVHMNQAPSKSDHAKSRNNFPLSDNCDVIFPEVGRNESRNEIPSRWLCQRISLIHQCLSSIPQKTRFFDGCYGNHSDICRTRAHASSYKIESHSFCVSQRQKIEASKVENTRFLTVA